MVPEPEYETFVQETVDYHQKMNFNSFFRNNINKTMPLLVNNTILLDNPFQSLADVEEEELKGETLIIAKIIIYLF